MTQYLITWNVGYGENAEVIEASSLLLAEVEAYERAKEEFEMNADYAAEEASCDNASNFGIEHELDIECGED